MTRQAHNDALHRAMTNCAKEPVHSPGAIQPHGCLLCFDRKWQKTHLVSANITEMLEIPVMDALSADPQELLVRSAIRKLQPLLRDENGPVNLAITRQAFGGRRMFHVTAYRSNEHIVVELEPESRRGIKQLLSALNDWILEVSQAEDRDELLATLTRATREISGYDRALAYRFDEDWHSEVLAESRIESARSFHGHHFPASDIPEQVRKLYFSNPLRTIPDAQQEAVPLVWSDRSTTPAPLDLSRGVLRAVSPIHVRYLANMSVRSSTSFAIRSKTHLWGLLSLHAAKAIPLPPATRSSLLVLAQAASQRLFLLQSTREEAFLDEVRRSRKMLSDERGRLPQPAELLAKHGEDLRKLFKACGIALVYQDDVSVTGTVPAPSALPPLVEWLRQQASGEGAWRNHRLHESLPNALRGGMRGCCGLLAISLVDDVLNAGWLLLFRAETPVTQLWAGRAEDKLTWREGGPTLSPERSLDLWRKEVRGHSTPWTSAEERAGRDLGEDLAVLVSAREISRLRDQAERQNRALEEMNQQLDTMAHIDPLTSLWNRRRIEEAIDAELSIAEREGRDFAVLLFDVDYFKRINDTYGHDVGDHVLKGLAELARHEQRGGDALGRWGGEEFLFTASGANAEAARQIAERLRQRIAESTFEPVGHVTVSVGLSAWQPGDSRDDLVRRADQALYEAKAAGRNCARIRQSNERER